MKTSFAVLSIGVAMSISAHAFDPPQSDIFSRLDGIHTSQAGHFGKQSTAFSEPLPVIPEVDESLMTGHLFQ